MAVGTLIHTCGFDHLASMTEAFNSGEWGNTTGFGANILGPGRTGTGCAGGDANAGIHLILPGGMRSALVASFAYVFNTGGSGQIFYFRRSSGGDQLGIGRDPSTGRLAVYRNGTIINVTSYFWPVASFISVQVRVAFATGATGAYKVVVNGTTTVADVTNVQTAVTAAEADQLVFRGQGGSNGGAWDDVAAFEDGDLPGDIKVKTLYPNANGDSSQWVGSDGNSTDNYLLVDEATPNDDTDYVESSTAGDKDLYNFGAVGFSGTVYGVLQHYRARKTDAGTRSVKSVAKSGGTEDNGVVNSIGTGYTTFRDMRTTKPGGGAWTVSDVDSSQFGVIVDT